MSKPKYIERKLTEFIEKNGYIPEIFTAWNCADIGDIATTLTTTCGNPTCTNSMVVIEVPDEYELPMFVTDTITELAKHYGVSTNLVKSSISHKRNGKRSGRKFVKVNVEN